MDSTSDICIPEWKQIKIGDVTQLLKGKRSPAKYYVDKEHPDAKPYIRITDFDSNNVSIYTSAEWCLECKEEDTLIAMDGSIGESDFGWNGVLSHHILCLRPIKEKIEPYYLYSFIKLKYKYLSNMNTGSVSPSLRQDVIRNLKINIPSIKEQQKIVDILYSLDQKIQLNTQMNTTLEAIGQALFKHWFVDFEFPDENGNPYKSSGGEMVDSELGEIPKGWKVGYIKNMLIQSKETINPNNIDEFFYHYSIPSYDNNEVPLFEDSTTIKSNKYILQSNCILFSKLNPSTPRIWLINKINKKSICSTEFLVLVPKIEYYLSYCYYLISYKIFINNMAVSASGTSSSHQRIKPSDLLNYKTIIPSNEMSLKFNRLLRSLHRLIDTNKDNNITLTNIRDHLLPKLMSGEIRVPIKEELKA